jgi:hypothetical protein
MLLPPETAKKTSRKNIPRHTIIANIARTKRMAISFDKSTVDSAPMNALATTRHINNAPKTAEKIEK